MPSDSDFDCSSPTTMTETSISSVGTTPLVDTAGPDFVCAGTTMDYDAISEVLSWMPAKSAIKYSSALCRPLHNIHSEPSFIEKQCLHSHGRDTAFFLQPLYGSYPSSVEFLALPSPDSSGILPESLDSIHHHGSIAASSNGLLLLARKSGFDFLSAQCSSSDVELSVFNPATGALASLPSPAGYNILLRDGVFGFSSVIECCFGNTTNSIFPNDYNIALLVETQPDPNILFGGWDGWRRHLLIYANDKWEKELCDVDINGCELRFDMPVAVYSKATEGLVVHYLCDDGNGPCNIVAFDIRKKRLWRSIKLPEMEEDRGLRIFKWNETGICLVRRFKGVFQVWVMDECGGLRSSESWRKVMEMTEEEMGLDAREGNVEGFGVASGRGLLVATKSRVYVYVMEGENRGRLEVVGEYTLGGVGVGVKITSYANTLRPVCM